MARQTVFDVIALGFLAFTGLLSLGLFWLWWLERRDAARRKKRPPQGSH